MKLIPVTGPGAIPPNGTPEHVRSAKAIAAFNKGISSYDNQPQSQVVQNQNQISPEEMGAIKAKSNQVLADAIDQKHIGESDVTEPQVPVSVEPPKAEVEDPTLSRQFAQLARQERSLRAKAQQQEQAIKAREAAIATREAEIKAKELEYQQGYISKSRLKQETLQALADADVSYDEITQQMLETPTKTDPRVLNTISKLEAKIQELEGKAKSTEDNYKSSQQQAYDSAIKQIRVDVDNLVKSDENYETIRATKSSKDVVDLIVRTYNEDGILLSVEEAANEVENHILEEAVKLSKLNKVTKRMQSVAPAQSNKPGTKTVQFEAQTPPKQPMKTLTNAAGSTRQLSARERALLAFKGELK